MRVLSPLLLCCACTSDDPTNGLVEIVLHASSIEIDSRQTIEFSVLGSYEDGTEADITADTALSSNDENILRLGLVDPYQGHGIGEGLAKVGAVIGDLQTDPIEIAVFIAAPQVGDLVINEVLADDGDADANEDGSTEDEADEYIELVNIGFYTVDLGGVVVRDSNYSEIGPRHTFESPTPLLPGQAIVVFGGGSVDTLSVEGTTFVVASNDDTGLSHGLSLNNTGEYISLVNEDAAVLVNLAYGDEDATGENEAIDDASLNRNLDIFGPDYRDHRLVEGATTAYSPGTRANGDPFPDLDEWFSQLLPD